MFKYIMSKCCIVIFAIISMSCHMYAQKKNDTNFLDWNRETFSSLERQAASANREQVKALYENRKKALMAYLEIDSISTINKRSIRYEFLNKVVLKYPKTDFLIIETNETGYVTTLKNFIVYTDSMQHANIKVYVFEEGKWRQKNKCELDSVFIEGNLKNYVAEFGQGFNKSGDVIISRFINKKVKESEYYLISTLSNQTGIRNIIHCY